MMLRKAILSVSFVLLSLGLIQAGCGEGPSDVGDDAGEARCGNGKIEGDEDCDDGNTDNSDNCLATCMWARCDDGYLHAGVEECDGEDLGGQDCTAVGDFTGGDLACSPDCTFDTTACTLEIPPDCGNGEIDEGEDCDGENLNGNDCTTIPGDFIGGELGCKSYCSFDTSDCIPEPQPPPPRECEVDTDCVTQGACCHPGAQQCVPQDEYVHPTGCGGIMCTTVCEMCSDCRCQDGQCITDKVEGCC